MVSQTPHATTDSTKTALLSPSLSPSPAGAFCDYGSTTSLIHDARAAHNTQDASKSRALHELKLQMRGTPRPAKETHLIGGDHIKSAVFGGLDGIITTFATVTSVAGSGLPHSVILIVGLAHLVADELSMGLGDMISSQAEAELVQHERAREVWEFQNFPQGEVDEMVELYERKGLTPDDAALVVQTLAKYQDAFIDNMMVEELGLLPANDGEANGPLQGGLITFAAFMVFGVVPLLSYLVNLLPGMSISASTTFNASCVLTVATLFLLGAVKGSFVGQVWYTSGAMMMVNGSVAAFCGWLIGYLLQLSGIQDVA